MESNRRHNSRAPRTITVTQTGCLTKSLSSLMSSPKLNRSQLKPRCIIVHAQCLDHMVLERSNPEIQSLYTILSQAWHSLSQLIVGKLWTKWRILFPALVVFDLTYRGWVRSALWTLVLLPAHARCEFRAKLAFLFLSGTPCGTENTLLRNCNLKRPVHNVWRTFCPCHNCK